MPSNADRVRDFHIAVGDPPPATPTRPAARTVDLRETLITEEYQETQRAFQQLRDTPDGDEPAALAYLAHELADLLYVTYGTLIALGVDADAVFAEVHRANMHKTTGPKRADGKQLKPADWQPADVAAVLKRQGEPG